MKSADLKILVQEGEGTTLELKESLPAALARDLVAMANTVKSQDWRRNHR